MANTLQTIANSSQAQANIWPTTRKRQMIWLSVLTAITLIGQYVMLGETGLSKQILGDTFQVIELSLWGARALVEVFVVIYIAMTKTNSDKEEKTLSRFKLTLILLIILTVGPVWLSRQYQVENLDAILSVYGTYLWAFSIAGISAVMLWGVATAYKYQPVDEGHFILPLADYEKMLAAVAGAEVRAIEARAVADTLRAERDRAVYELNGMREAVGVFRFLPASAQIQIVAMFANGLPPADKLAEEFGLSASTVRGVLARVNNGTID